MDDIERALSEALRVLKPQGRLVILDTDWDTLVWRAGDPDLMARAMVVHEAVYTDAHLPKSLPQRLSRAGFRDTNADSFVVLNTEFGEDTYARQSAGIIVSIMEGPPDFSTAEPRSWLNDLESLEQAGGFFFSLNRYIVSAIK